MTQKMITLNFTELELRMLALLADHEFNRMEMIKQGMVLEGAPPCEVFAKVEKAQHSWKVIAEKVAVPLEGS